MTKLTMTKLKWGVIGAGQIANRFLRDLALLPDAELVGVTSRNFLKATELANLYKARAYESTGALLDSDVDIVYVATPHTRHLLDSLAAIAARKAVLCEKPFAINAFEAAQVSASAFAANTFLMEALWTRFFPAVREILDILASGQLGELLTVESSFGYKSNYDPGSREFDPCMGGGSLLDVGVYCVALAQLCFGQQPSKITSSAQMTASGVDGFAQWTLEFESGGFARGSSAITQKLANDAVIVGSKGEIRLPQFWCPREFILNGKSYGQEFAGEGFQFEAREVMTCVRENRIESRLLPLSFSMGVTQTMDQIRHQFGLRYPGERTFLSI